MLFMHGMYFDQSLKQSFRNLQRRLSRQPKTENAHPNSEAAHVLLNFTNFFCGFMNANCCLSGVMGSHAAILTHFFLRQTFEL